MAAPGGAADEIARGEEAAQRVRALADRTVVELTSDATREADIIRGQADAERNAIFAQAFGADPEFFEFYRSLTAYERALQGAIPAWSCHRTRNSSTICAAIKARGQSRASGEHGPSGPWVSYDCGGAGLCAGPFACGTHAGDAAGVAGKRSAPEWVARCGHRCHFGLGGLAIGRALTGFVSSYGPFTL